MDAIDLVKEHFAALGTKIIEVPEWKLKIHATPVTIAEKARLYKKGGTDLEVLVDVLIMKAADGDGKPLFTLEHKAALLTKASSVVIGRIANEILDESAPRVAELKN